MEKGVSVGDVNWKNKAGHIQAMRIIGDPA
jgi:hypothetical protein